MNRKPLTDPLSISAASGRTNPLRQELAAEAARWVADSGLDYASAKRKAVRQLLGEARSARMARDALPDNEEIDAALLEHLSLFDEGHADRVSRLRRLALDLLDDLGEFRPYLTGAVWKGIVSEHSPIHIQLFHDDPKAVLGWLMDRGISFESTELPDPRGESANPGEAFACLFQGERVLIALHPQESLQGTRRGRSPERGDAQALARLLAENP